MINNNNRELVLHKSQSFFEQIVVTRLWNSNHNGVYVAVTPDNQPNEYLTDSLRDIYTKSGIKLTKINPAYMTRQISEINKKDNDLHFHITSLNPIRPDNKADEWEIQALKSFENGNDKILQLVETDSVKLYRYMAPLVTKQSCLKCHAIQGYKEGDIRGGISVSFPADLYLTLVKRSTNSSIIIHLVVLLIGLIGAIVMYRRLKFAYLTIESSNMELLEANITKDKFFSIIAHDLRSPFNSIVGFSNYLVEKIRGEDYTEMEKITNMILKSSGTAMDLLNNLMIWARSQSGKLEFNPEYFDISVIVKEVMQLLDSTAFQKSISISNLIPPNSMVFADKDMTSTIIRNLVSNALKYTNEDGKILISSKSLDNFFMVKITDNGVGITKDRINKLFKIAETESTLGTQKEKGTGLGLILCKEFVEKNSGEIWVESKPNMGTTFSFTLPINSIEAKD